MSLFGPLLPFELTRIVRKRWLTLARTIYALVLAAAVVITYVANQSRDQPRPTRPGELADLTQGLFFGLFGLQAALAGALVPRWIADAITGEKERQTLPFLLLTDLSSREIILGKLAARLAQLLMFLLAGLPILAVLQFLGGVEPALVVVGYVALFATLLSLGCLSMLCSVYGRTTKAATQHFSRIVAIYVFLFVIVSGGVLRAWPEIGAWPGTVVQPAFLDVRDVYNLLDSGNPITAGERVIGGLRVGGHFDDVLWPATRDYLLFHLTVAAVCGVWAVRKLRPVAADRGDGPPLPSKKALLKPVTRPPVGDRPVLWKALYFDIRVYRSTGGRVFTRIVYVLSFAPVVVALIIDYRFNNLRNAADIMNIICRGLVTLALTGMLVIIASQACNAVGRERDKRTLDELLLTDLSTEEILNQKWWGSIGVVRWGLVWVAVHWLVAVLTGGLHVLAIPVLILEWTTYATFAASLGIYFAGRMYSTQGANGATGLVGFALGAVPVVLGLVIIQLLKTDLNSLGMTLIWLSPPAALGVSAVSVNDVHSAPSDFLPWLTSVAIGVPVSLVVCGLWSRRLWRGACWWFPRMVGRH